MPFLFERIDDETELLLPDNLLRTDSVIAKLVSAIDEEDWKEVEIIGWLYQFYISEKKDDVIGKVVKSEDIPAATQLFTPNWIVQYLVQNSVGRLWLMANPASTLKAQWPYYIEPAEQTPEVQAQLDALIQQRMDEDGGSLNPETITLLDPACGSGHILVEAYEVLKSIYLERGYQPRAIPRLILEKNLYGLDIDDRAAQMAGFALLMKARADDRRLFNEPIKLNVLALQESKGLDADVLTRALQTVTGGSSPQMESSAATNGFGDDDLFPGTRPQISLGDSIAADPKGDPARPAIAGLITAFVHAKTFGSLIQIPQELNTKLSTMAERLQLALLNGDLYAKAAAQDLRPLVAQARVLGMHFDAVVANPPYMGGKGMNAVLKDYARETFSDSKSDLFAMFIERGLELCKATGFNSMVTMQSWMFLSSFETMRMKLLRERTIMNMAHLGARAFAEISGEVVQTTAFVQHASHLDAFKPVFFRLTEGSETEKQSLLLIRGNRFDEIIQSDFHKIPGSPIAYWVGHRLIGIFGNERKIKDYCHSFQGIITGNNGDYVRHWFELDFKSILLNLTTSKSVEGVRAWIPYGKGGSYKKWYGNNEHVLRWNGSGDNLTRSRTENRNYFFKEGLSWSDIASSKPSFRFQPTGLLFDAKAPSAF